MQGTRRIIITGVILAAVLLAGAAAGQGGEIMLSRNGNIVTISGSTNLAAGDRLLVNVVSAGFTPTEKGTGGGFSGAAGTVVVRQGSPLNSYAFEVDVSAFPPGAYLVTVESVETGFRDSARFVLPWTPVPATPPATPPPVTATLPPSTLATPPATQTTTAQIPFPAILSLGAFTLALCLMRVRGSRRR